MTGNKITDKFTNFSKTSQQNYSETVTDEHDKEKLKKDKYLQKNGKKLLMTWYQYNSVKQYNNGISKSNRFVRQCMKSIF